MILKDSVGSFIFSDQRSSTIRNVQINNTELVINSPSFSEI